MQVKKQQWEYCMEQLTGSKLEQEYFKAVCCYPAYLYAEYITWNAGQDESQAGIKIAARNTNNLRYADDMTLMAENEEELKNLLIRMKEESEKAGLKFKIQAIKIMTSSPITLKGLAVSRELHGEFMTSREEDFDPAPEIRLDHSKILCNKFY